MWTILQVTPELQTGGVERTTIDIAAAIVAASGRALVASAGGRLEPELAAVGGELIRMPLASKNPMTLALNARRLARVVRLEGVDIVHARSRAPAWSALWAARAAGVGFVTTYAGIHAGRGRLKRGYNGVMARGDLVIANSAYTAEHVARVHGAPASRLRVIPRGVDVDALDPRNVSADRVAALRSAWGLSGEAPVVLLPGRLTRWKGQAVAIAAVARARACGAGPFQMVLAGDDQGRTGYRAELEALIARHGLEDSVKLVGHCADMPAAYAFADVVVSASTEPEAFGRVAVEAQCMGRPVIATDHGGARETVVDPLTGRLVPPGDVEALSASLVELLSMSAGSRLVIGERGAERARRLFCVEAMQAATLAVYTEVMEASA